MGLRPSENNFLNPLLGWTSYSLYTTMERLSGAEDLALTICTLKCYDVAEGEHTDIKRQEDDYVLDFYLSGSTLCNARKN